MSVNAREEEMEHIEIFKKPALFTNGRIDRDTVPKGWYCYDLRGSDFDPGRPSTLEDKVAVNHAGSILSPIPLKRASTEFKRLDGTLNFLGEDMTLAEFCEQHGLYEYPDTRKYAPRPASPDEAGLFFTSDQAKDLAGAGKQTLRDAAASEEPHSYSWFVIENLGTEDEDQTSGLSLEKAVQRYKEIDYGIKVLGVTKDGASTVDLVATRYGELQYLSYYEDMESFNQDPVITAAVQKLHQELTPPPQAPSLTML